MKVLTLLLLVLVTGAALAAPQEDQQSPVDIAGSPVTRVLEPAPEFFFARSTTLLISNTFDPTSVVPEEFGTLRATPPSGNYAVWLGSTWDLIQFHLHFPAEHWTEEDGAAGELHLVHIRRGYKACEPDALMVVAVRVKPGRHHPEFRKFLRKGLALPENSSEPAARIRGFGLDRLLPKLSPRRIYDGSLTGPAFFGGADAEGGCAGEKTLEDQLRDDLFPENVSWVVLGSAIELSATQIARARNIFSEANSREYQPLNGRTVREVVR